MALKVSPALTVYVVACDEEELELLPLFAEPADDEDFDNLSTCPGKIVELLRLFQLIKSFNLTEYFIAIPLKVSPALTVCVLAEVEGEDELFPVLLLDEPELAEDLDTLSVCPG